ncbi:uncharacterized protein PG998_008893 [Apiospora kogelbergensis]|uniref:uncharacterized protein n=1 Tax=Apiospora kogelbergensis TaxID=1337665 RepID=UPI003130C816
MTTRPIVIGRGFNYVPSDDEALDGEDSIINPNDSTEDEDDATADLGSKESTGSRPAKTPLLSRIAVQHGGYKDAATAHRTLALNAHRSLLYQQQVVRTYLMRAKNHPHIGTSPGMRAAIAVFEDWMSNTVPAQQNSLRAGGFRPLVVKETVRALLQPWIQAACPERRDDATNTQLISWDHEAGLPQPGEFEFLAFRFANFYATELRSRGKLGNQMLAETQSMNLKIKEQDWERVRYEALSEAVPAGKETMEGWEWEELWEQDEVTPTRAHLALLAWAWSPVPKRTLEEKVKRLVEGSSEEA